MMFRGLRLRVIAQAFVRSKFGLMCRVILKSAAIPNVKRFATRKK